MIRSTVAILALLAVGLVAGLGLAQDRPPSSDEKSVRAALKSVVDSFNKHDAAKLAAHWMPNGTYEHVGVSERIAGREAIQAAFEASFAENEKVQLSGTIDEIRFVVPTVAILEGGMAVSDTGEEPRETRITLVFVKQEKAWLLESVRETDPPGPESAHDYLQELAWIVGTWADESEEASVRTVAKWAAGGNFLTRSYKVQLGDRIDSEGTQVIGWDPVAEQIRSWSFDSDGSFSEGYWTRSGDTWSVAMSGVLEDGRSIECTQVLRRADDNTIMTRMVGIEVDGVISPNLDEVKVVRQPEKTQTSSTGETP